MQLWRWLDGSAECDRVVPQCPDDEWIAVRRECAVVDELAELIGQLAHFLSSSPFASARRACWSCVLQVRVLPPERNDPW